MGSFNRILYIQELSAANLSVMIPITESSRSRFLPLWFQDVLFLICRWLYCAHVGWTQKPSFCVFYENSTHTDTHLLGTLNSWSIYGFLNTTTLKNWESQFQCGSLWGSRDLFIHNKEAQLGNLSLFWSRKHVYECLALYNNMVSAFNYRRNCHSQSISNQLLYYTNKINLVEFKVTLFLLASGIVYSFQSSSENSIQMHVFAYFSCKPHQNIEIEVEDINQSKYSIITP